MFNHGCILCRYWVDGTQQYYFTYVKSAYRDKRDWTSLNVENAADTVESNMDISAMLDRDQATNS